MQTRWVSHTLEGAGLAALALVGALPSAHAQPLERAPVVRVVQSAGSRTPLRGWKEGVQNLTLLDLQGNDITDQLAPLPEASGVSLAVPGGEQFVAKPKTIAQLPLTQGQRTVLPGGIVIPLSRGPAAAPELVWFRLTVIASPLPAAFDARRQEYSTTLSFGLTQPPAAPANTKPERAIVVKLAFDGLRADDVPPIVLSEAGIEHEKTVTLSFVPTSDTPRLLLRSTLSDTDLELRAAPRLEVRPQQQQVLGLGLAEVSVAVQRVAAHGAALPASHELPVLLELDRGTVPTPRNPAIESGASSATFSLRSAGIGPLHVTASADGLSGSASFEQTLPFGPLLAALMGGALGAYARRFVDAPHHATSRRVLEGLIVALITFVGGVLGAGLFELLPASIVATEAGAFLTGSLSGYLGCTLLERWTTLRQGARESGASTSPS
jgi:hypothetical protein